MTGITFVAPSALLGGAERYLENVLTRIDRASIDRIVVLQDGAFPDRLRGLGFDPVVIPTTASKLDGARTAWRLRRLLGRTPTIVHANGIKAALIAELATIGSPHRVVWVRHDFSWSGALARVAAMRADAVVGVSAAVVADVRHDRVTVIPPGIEVQPVDRATARRTLVTALDLDPGAFVVALVGRLDPVKGHRELLAALPAIAAALPRVVVLVIGADEPTNPQYADEIRCAAERASTPVRMLGQRTDVLDVVAASDVLVAPSVPSSDGLAGEAAGIVVLEAMSVGTPVVAYDNGGLPEMVGDAGLLVPQGDRDELANAIVRIGGDAQLADELRSRGAARVRSCFAIDETVAAMRRVYSEVDSDR